MMASLGHRLVVLAATVMTISSVASQDMVGPVEQVGVDVGVMVGQVVEHHLTGCHLVLITTTQHSHVFSSIIRHMGVSMEAGVVVEAGWVLSQDQVAQDHLLQRLLGEVKTTCRALILDLTTNNRSADIALRLAEVAGLWKTPETRVVVVGGMAGVKDVLLHHSLRNTVHGLYLALHDLTLHTPPRIGSSRLRKALPREGVSERVWVYRRCLYCNNGEADVQYFYQWNSTSFYHLSGFLLNEPLQNMMGQKLRVVTLPLFPYMDYSRINDEPGNMVAPKDSLDVRLISTFAAVFNFTYEVIEEPNRSFGNENGGNFTGMIGQLQREESDFCTIVAPTPGRLKVTEFIRGYPADMLVVTSLKPTLLPAHLSLVRPFARNLWFALLASVVTWGLIMWGLQRTWRWVTGGRGLRFSTALLYGWGALLEQPPVNPSVNDSGRLLVGWWLVFCLIITTGFRSSLIAHLTVQGKSSTLDSFQDLLGQGNWRWGSEPWFFNGAALEYFSKHTDPVVQQIYKGMEVLVVKEALRNVLAGGFSFITVQNYITVIITSMYTDANGETPFYISNKGRYILACFGWGLRKGAPFYQRFVQLMSRLEDAGIIQHWTNDVIARRVRENRAAATLDPQAAKGDPTQDDNGEVVLGLNHLQGAFFLLFLGCIIALLMLLGENFIHSLSSPKQHPSRS
ncbi:uncharacterized protein LOC121873784 [Homarus americanus]|uniref:uncharacterized protein LOC121873784 n=1 Tax=Homarus americanus TaxID=6706 RepID=UPI001C44090A|nr:uncharacterized protein LOC121873784 [Homarus americanus]